MSEASGTGRREFLRSAAVLGGGLTLAGGEALATAAGDPMAAIRAAAEANREADIERIQDWIRLPSIAAEDLNMAEGAAYMADLARDAGFTGVQVVGKRAASSASERTSRSRRRPRVRTSVSSPCASR